MNSRFLAGGTLRRVALIYDATRAYDLKVMTGVAGYLQEGARWSVYLGESALKDQRLPNLGSWQGDGVIANFDDPGIARTVARSGLATVAFGSGYGWYAPASDVPYFFTNNRSIAHMAADHFIDRGFLHFAYCGYPRTRINGWSEEREAAFKQYLGRRKLPCRIFRAVHSNEAWASVQQSLRVWLKSLPKPTALMAANDNRARQVLEACRSAGLQVPEDVAVIGVDNDELLCQLSTPLLSSVEQGAKRIGYEAAALLDRIMSGQTPHCKQAVIDPVGIATRRSTDVLAIRDAKVARAMAFVRDHAGEGLKVQDVVRAVAMSRSGLEVRFKASLGVTIHGSIRRVQMERVRRLVADTNLPLKEIAANNRLSSVQYMTALFAKTFGHPPGEYRAWANAGHAGELRSKLR